MNYDEKLKIVLLHCIVYSVNKTEILIEELGI